MTTRLAPMGLIRSAKTRLHSLPATGREENVLVSLISLFISVDLASRRELSYPESSL